MLTIVKRPKAMIGVGKLFRNFHTKHRIGILGVPLAHGQPKSGTDLAPSALRNAGLVGEITKIASANVRKVYDYGDLVYNVENFGHVTNMKNFDHVVSCNRALYYKIQQILKENDQFITIGGDHSIAIGSIGGHLAHNPDIALLWIDAHADINLNSTSPSGNIHGMPASILINELQNYWKKMPVLDWIKNRISAKRIAYIGLRDIDVYENRILEKLGIAAFGMNTIDKNGIEAVLDMAMKTIDPNSYRKLHISFDIDVLDPQEAPSTGTPVSGGLTLREAIFIMEKLYQTGRISGVDLVEVNPNIGTDQNVQKTIDAALHILKAAFGHNRSGDSTSHIQDLEKYFN